MERNDEVLLHTTQNTKEPLASSTRRQGQCQTYLDACLLPSPQGQESLRSTARHFTGFTKGKRFPTYIMGTKQTIGVISVVLECGFQATSAVFIFSEVCEKLTDQYYAAD